MWAPPKVGDTISAIVDPENATPVEFAWFMGDSENDISTAIEGADGSSLAVTDAMLGKFIKVVATGLEESSASAQTTAAVAAQPTDKIAIASAKQTGAATIEVILTKPASTGYTFSVTKGSTAQTITTAFDEAGTTATLTLGTAIQAADYVVKVVSATDKEETAEATVTGKIASLKSIDFLGDELILADSTLTKASTTLVGYNDFEEKVALTGSLTLTSTKGKATYTASTNKVVCDTSAVAGLLFTPGETVTLTGVYPAGTTILQVSKALTVSARATLTEFEVGDLTTTKKDLKDKKVTLENLATNTYYFPVKKAEDQYGNKLSADELSKMMVTTTQTTGNLYINPYLAAGSYAYVNDFVELSDGTTAMQIYKGSLTSPGTQPISITGVSGFQGTLSVKVEDNPYIATLNVSAPTFYDSEKAEITISAVDQDGNAYNLYNKVQGVSADGKTLTFKDKNNLTTISSYIQVTDGRLSFKENSTKESVAFFYTGTATDATHSKNVVATIMPASSQASNQTWTVQPATSVAGIKSFDKDLTVVASGTVATGTRTNFTWLSSSGAALDNVGDAAKLPAYTADITNELTLGNGYKYGVKVSPAAWAVAGGNVTAPAAVSAANNTATITVSLYKLETVASSGTAGDAKYNELAKKTFTATAYDGTAKTYTASLAAGSELLNATKNSGDATAFSVKQIDAQGVASPNAPAYTVTVTDDLGIDGQTVVPGAASAGSKGTAKATIWVNSKAVATVDVPYDVAAPAAQSVSTYDKTNKKASTKDAFDAVTALTQNADGSMTVVDGATTYELKIVDQYNMSMKNTDWKLGGKALANGTNAYNNIALVANSAKINGSWAITGASVVVINNGSAASYSVETASALNSAITKAAADPSANTITVTKDIDLNDLTNNTYLWSIESGDTLVIPAGVILKDSNDNGDEVTLNIKTGGTLQIEGTLIDCASEFAIDNAGKIKGAGHYTQSNYSMSAGGSINLTGATWEILVAPTITGGTISGNIEIKDDTNNVNFSNAEKVDGASIVGKSGKSVALPKSSTAQVIAGTTTYDIATDANAVATVTVNGNTASTAVTGTGTATVKDETTGQTQTADTTHPAGPTMDPIATVLSKYTLVATPVTLNNSLTIGAPKYEYTSGGDAVYTYKVTGTIAYDDDASTKLGYGDPYHWFFGLDTPSITETGATHVYGALASTVAAVDSASEITTQLDDAAVTETTMAEFVKGFQQSGTTAYTGDKIYAIKYEIGSQNYIHIYDLSEVTFSAKAAS